MSTKASSYTALSFEKNGAVARITLNRPDAANGLNMDMGRDLMNVALHCEQDETIRAVIITGTGNFFCAGGDLKAFAAYGADIGVHIPGLINYLHTAMSCFARLNAPVIVAVNGIAAGAGFSIAMVGDFVLAADNATFTMAYTAAGLSPDGSASYFLPRLVGLRRAQELMMSNRRLSAVEAQEWGLVTHVYSAEKLQAEADTLAAELACGATKALSAVKQLLLASFDNSLDGQLALEGRNIAQCAVSRDGQEGIQAFLAKRKPAFEGK